MDKGAQQVILTKNSSKQKLVEIFLRDCMDGFQRSMVWYIDCRCSCGLFPSAPWRPCAAATWHDHSAFWCPQSLDRISSARFWSEAYDARRPCWIETLSGLPSMYMGGYTQLSTMTDMAILTRASSAEVEAQVVEVEHLVARKVVEECTTASGRPAGLAPQCNRGRRQERGAIQLQLWTTPKYPWWAFQPFLVICWWWVGDGGGHVDYCSPWDTVLGMVGLCCGLE